jgi:hypothetical protein
MPRTRDLEGRRRKRKARIGIQEGEGRYEANPSFLFH